MKKDFDFDNIGTHTRYDVPDGFFESLTQKTMQNIKAREQARLRKNTILRRYIISASAVAAAMILVFIPNIKDRDNIRMAKLTTEQSIDESIEFALASMSDSEISELAIIVESDIFYTDNSL